MSDRAFSALLWSGAVLLVVLALVFTIVDCSEQRECRDNGGRVEHYNYRTVMMPMSCGSNCTMIVPVETSDWRCVMPERPQP